jgi:hypothetical protein
MAMASWQVEWSRGEKEENVFFRKLIGLTSGAQFHLSKSYIVFAQSS